MKKSLPLFNQKSAVGETKTSMTLACGIAMDDGREKIITIAPIFPINKGSQTPSQACNHLIFLGAGARVRTGMPLRAGDFESPASTSFTTPAQCV